jgi:hypothetical protein
VVALDAGYGTSIFFRLQSIDFALINKIEDKPNRSSSDHHTARQGEHRRVRPPRRFSIQGRPPWRCLGGFGSKSAIFFHCVSVSNGPVRAIDPPSELLILLIQHFGKCNHHLLKRLY